MRLVYAGCALVLSVTFASAAFAQMKVGNSPASLNANAVLEVEHTSKGFLLPRVALTSTSSASPLSAHVAGMSVYNTATTGDVTPGVYTNNGSRWITAVATCTCGDVKTGFQSANHGDWKLMNGTSYTGSCGTFAINAANAYLAQNGTTLGSFSGSNTKTIAQANLPNVNLTAQSAGNHSHTTTVYAQYNGTDDNNYSSEIQRGDAGTIHTRTWTSSENGAHTHSVPLNGNVTQQALDIRPWTMSVNYFVCVN